MGSRLCIEKEIYQSTIFVDSQNALIKITNGTMDNQEYISKLRRRRIMCPINRSPTKNNNNNDLIKKKFLYQSLSKQY